MSLYLRKGIDGYSAGTLVELVADELVSYGETEYRIGKDHYDAKDIEPLLVERRPRTHFQGPNRKQRRRVDPIVQAKREAYEQKAALTALVEGAQEMGIY